MPERVTVEELIEMLQSMNAPKAFATIGTEQTAIQMVVRVPETGNVAILPVVSGNVNA